MVRPRLFCSTPVDGEKRNNREMEEKKNKPKKDLLSNKLTGKISNLSSLFPFVVVLCDSVLTVLLRGVLSGRELSKEFWSNVIILNCKHWLKGLRSHNSITTLMAVLARKPVLRLC